ncbi:sporulation-specific diadenylate cyclase CdaS [Paenibacillus alginolyticus]|uniref:Diadenylate cyclase n=1 Tax=Paenibacillus alginolyticus TaxID=59839 RepID=A0ABT4GEZ6_9BACL|nr:sporulation-specific diadenylate cyclase CdaS [Paenibacillus alginolyticus]MCY9664200.1 sporulation-specific diadenylate cyclase CdaS [Paenibacillus alginolyticus]MCY9694757.1 sporulation-specific diadenylate cyclase CdaS [Paenibacillus alginolyticus]MEC0147072.1 sporulation-specific diadenylate cyclase CdaS [Paenibacillus alginolyticus]
MQQENCDISPMKEQLKQQLRHISAEIECSLDTLDNDENNCLLSRFDEIREAFKQVESIAASFYLQCYLSSFTSHYLDLSICIQHLSERRHGALIVIQRNDLLDMFMHSGIRLEATLTYSLLEAIFYPGNPLHDGALLIQSDRIISAANVLPVSNITVEKKMGTRHRAAIGLTERTDALVLVVSEETGQASFAYKGILHPINSLDPMI